VGSGSGSEHVLLDFQLPHAYQVVVDLNTFQQPVHDACGADRMIPPILAILRLCPVELSGVVRGEARGSEPLNMICTPRLGKVAVTFLEDLFGGNHSPARAGRE
jgi:hypothetical protein